VKQTRTGAFDPLINCVYLWLFNNDGSVILCGLMSYNKYGILST
jgi:hypothetical protein